jgi:hypothetical protein
VTAQLAASQEGLGFMKFFSQSINMSMVSHVFFRFLKILGARIV